MNKKGFTLIELLAVIVILAIIALIATPAVLNIIEDSKESAARDSAMTISKAAETHYMSNVTLQGEEVTPIDLTKDTLQYKGEKPEKGYIEFDDKGNAYLKMYMNGYCVVSDYDNTVVSEKMDSDECNVSSVSSLRLFEDGEVVYFNPVTNEICNRENEADKYHIDNSLTNFTGTSFEGYDNNLDYYWTTMKESQSGCMKWHAFLDTEDATSVKLLLDHNTTRSVAWNEEGGNTPVTALAALADDVSGWDDNVKSTVRLITATEVDAVADKYALTDSNYGTASQTWDVTNVLTKYHIMTGKDEGEGDNIDFTSTGPNKLAWLLDNTSDICKLYGCEFASALGSPYWTSEICTSPISGATAVWTIHAIYGFSGENQTYENGIRPVIEVPKTKF